MKSFSGKTVLVTGATGLIGSHIVYELMSMKNVRVIALGRNIEKIKKIFKDYINNANFYYVVQDVSDPIDLKIPAAFPTAKIKINAMISATTIIRIFMTLFILGSNETEYYGCD